MRVGFTGHQRLQDQEAWTWAETALTAALIHIESLEGICSLAIGGDQLFARVVYALGGHLRVLVPFPEYERTFANNEDLKRYRELSSRAERIEVLPGGAS